MPLSVLMIGTGEYTTGYVHGKAADSDKRAGVVGIVLFDLRRRGKVSKLALCGTTGKKNTGIRRHLEQNIRDKYKDMNVDCVYFPEDGVDRDVVAYKLAIASMSPGDAVTIFTPDETHFDIAMEALRHNLHVLVAKPAVMTTQEHVQLVQEASSRNLLCMVEMHKRWDPIYADAVMRIRDLGDFGYFNAYMSQPKSQLLTFNAWAGKGSDISYYLNSHHLDLLIWAVRDIAKPIWVSACGSTGVATGEPYNCHAGTHDTITLMVQFQNTSGNLGTAVLTSSWTAANGAEVHSQQRFQYMGHKGEVGVDQAHRGYHVSTDENGYASVNPLYFRYTPDPQGYFGAQSCYGYRAIESFVDACGAFNDGIQQDWDAILPTAKSTQFVTAILEAGRKSLLNNGQPVAI
jgi:D-galacturonate reductase